MKIKHLTITSLCAAALLAAASSCGGGKPDVGGRLLDATNAVADEDWDSAQRLCNDIYRLLSTPDSLLVSETQAGELAILYMKVSEHLNEEENMADATQAFRYAFRRSDDSLRAFSMQLPLEEQRHFVLLRRIGLSIDNPVDLMDADLTHDGLPEDDDSIENVVNN